LCYSEHFSSLREQDLTGRSAQRKLAWHSTRGTIGVDFMQLDRGSHVASLNVAGETGLPTTAAAKGALHMLTM